MSETRKLAAILAADMVGYSRLTGADEEGTMRRLRALRAELIDPAIHINRGRVFHTAGDSILIEFASVVDAVRCSIDVQRGMAVRNGDFVPEKQIEFRVGIHLGDVMVQPDGDLLGDGVNIAARLEGIAEPGGVCLSNAAYEQVRDKVEASFVDLGERELKNIARPMRVFSLSTVGSPHRGTQGVSPPPPQAGGRLEGGLAVEQSPPRLSIVVLPFANVGGDAEQDYFVDGVTESLTTDLSRMRGLVVIARNTAFTYKGKAVDVKQIGRELNVRYVLEGSVQRGGNRIRVNVQLIDVGSGNHLWAERFDKPVADLFDMQDEIVSRLANQLGAELAAAEARRAEWAANPDSMDHYFRGLAWFNQGATPELCARARASFERAVALDPRNSEAEIGAAIVDASSGLYFVAEDRTRRLATAEAALAKALSVTPDHALAHLWLGVIEIVTNRVAQGVAECERALALDRNLADAHAQIGMAKYVSGQGEECEAHILEALRISPRDVKAATWYVYAGLAKLSLEEDEAAVQWFTRAIESNRNIPVVHFFLAAALVHLGRAEEAQPIAATGLTLDSAFTIARFRASASTGNPTYLARRERIYDGMRKAGVPEE